jgi:hypothetical protein
MHRFSSKAGVASAGIAFACIFLQATVHADEDDDDLIRRGLELRRQHSDVEALSLFEQAYRIRPTPRACAQMGLAEQSLGRWVDAESDLQKAFGADDAWIARNREPLADALHFVSSHLGWLSVSSNVQSARVSVNGTVVGTFPMRSPARVALGIATVRVEADGYLAVERTTRVEANNLSRESFTLVPQPSSAGPPATAEGGNAAGSPSVPPSAAQRLPWGTIAMGAFGVAGIGVGAAFGVDVLMAKATRDQHCAAGRCDPTGLAFDAHARQSAMISTIGFGVGVASTVVSAWLFWRASRGSQRIDIVPIMTSDSAGAGAVGVW